MSRVVAIDWSGRRIGAARHIWLAEAVDGELVDLSSGRTGAEAIAEAAERSPELIGLDFAFGFPEGWSRAQGWTRGRNVWEAAAREGEAWLAACEPPFWGRPGRGRPADSVEPLRVTDTDGAKSVFQIGGAGTVGTGSIRGMPHLLTLLEARFDVWPLERVGDEPRGVAVEIYPRLFTGRVAKSNAAARAGAVRELLAGQPSEFAALARDSEDAFDAAVSAVALSRHEVTVDWDVDERMSLEGRVYRAAG